MTQSKSPLVVLGKTGILIALALAPAGVLSLAFQDLGCYLAT